VDSVSTTGLVAIFLVGGVVTWVAGMFLSDSTDVIDDRFHLGQAIGGLILLGLAGTLPEIAITVTAALSGHLGLATGNLLGGIAMQTLVLVLLDATSRSRTPLSSLSEVLEPIVEALIVVLLVSLALLGPLLPASAAIGPVSPISILLAVAWLAGLFVIDRLSKDERWEAIAEHLAGAVVAPAPGPAAGVRPNRFGRASTRGVLVAFGAAALVTLVAGVFLEQTGNALADRWGINGVIFGATILAAVTALPEISTGIRAVRLGRVGLAMGDIFGGNQVQLTLFLVADLLAGKPVLHSVSTSSTWLGGMGAIVTAIFAVGLVVRPQRKVLGVGPDSLLVVLAYVLGVWGLAVIGG
jgi:cation:H+ antiporter